MNTYIRSYIQILRKDFMLVIIALMLLVLTFFVWVGIPVFVLGGVLAQITTSSAIIILGTSLAVSFLFSLYVLPINLKVAKSVAEHKKQHFLHSFFRLEATWIIVVTLIFSVSVWLLRQLSNHL